MCFLMPAQHAHYCWSMYPLSSRLCDLLWDFIQSVQHLPVESTSTFEWPLSPNLFPDPVFRQHQWKLPGLRQQLFELFRRRAQQLSRVLKFDRGPPRGILHASELRCQCNSRRTRAGRVPLGPRLRPTSIRHLRPDSSALHLRHRLASGDEYQWPRTRMVGDPTDGPRLRLHLPLHPRALPSAHAQKARTTNGSIRSVEEHRPTGRRVACETRIAILTFAARIKGR